MTTSRGFSAPHDLAAAGVRGVLFDVDGTLYSQPRLRVCMAGELAWATCRAPRAMRDVLRTIAAFRRTREALRAIDDSAELLEDLQYTHVAQGLGRDAADVRSVVEEWMFRRPLPYLRFAARPGLDGLLSELARQGIRIGALSDYPTDAKLEALGIRRYFSIGLCTTDPSVNAFKPHPKGFLVACAHWGLAPHEVLYVGDRPEIDAAGAAAAGTRCIIIGRTRRITGDRIGQPAVVRRFADLPGRVLAG
jgi:FMN phosphatase YigB (HAD superfamily)